MNGDLFGNGDVIVFRVVPVDEPDVPVAAVIIHCLNRITEELIDLFVNIVEVMLQICCCSGEGSDCLADEGVGVALFFQPVAECLLFDVCVVFAVLPVPEILVSEGVLEEGDDMILCGTFSFVDGCGHCCGKRIFPVRRSCIIPVLMH